MLSNSILFEIFDTIEEFYLFFKFSSPSPILLTLAEVTLIYAMYATSARESIVTTVVESQSGVYVPASGIIPLLPLGAGGQAAEVFPTN